MLKFRMKDGSGEVVLKRVSEDVDRHGNVRIYVRVPGKSKVRLISEIGTQQFLADYRAALAGVLIGSPRPQPLAVSTPVTSLTWLVQQYYRSAEFRGLGARAKYTRRLTLERLCATDGDKPYKLLETRHVRKMRDKMADRPEVANGMLKALSPVIPLPWPVSMSPSIRLRPSPS